MRNLQHFTRLQVQGRLLACTAAVSAGPQYSEHCGNPGERLAETIPRVASNTTSKLLFNFPLQHINLAGALLVGIDLSALAMGGACLRRADLLEGGAAGSAGGGTSHCLVMSWVASITLLTNIGHVTLFFAYRRRH